MNKDRARAILENEKELCGEAIRLGMKYEGEAKDFEEYIQALDIAIECMQQRYQINDKGEITPINNKERPQAKWEEVHNGCKTYFCSNCGNVRFSNYHNYCEECGAKMLVEPYVRSDE